MILLRIIINRIKDAWIYITKGKLIQVASKCLITTSGYKKPKRKKKYKK